LSELFHLDVISAVFQEVYRFEEKLQIEQIDRQMTERQQLTEEMWLVSSLEIKPPTLIALLTFSCQLLFISNPHHHPHNICHFLVSIPTSVSASAKPFFPLFLNINEHKWLQISKCSFSSDLKTNFYVYPKKSSGTA
jgi:hypothetical protein